MNKVYSSNGVEITYRDLVHLVNQAFGEQTAIRFVEDTEMTGVTWLSDDNPIFDGEELISGATV
jgi:hypothetical protein